MTRSFETGGAPHFPPHSTVAGVMRQVLYALVPGIAAHVWFFGTGILVQIALATGFALLLEALMLKLRGQPERLYLGDFSAVTTAVLFALCLPPLAPWWIALVGMIFAIVVAKHLYGGLGQNPFNPAMVGYVAVLVSFPQEMTAWLSPAPIADTTIGPWDSLLTIFSGHPPGGASWDSITGATPLDTIRTAVASGQMISEARQSRTGLGMDRQLVRAGRAVPALETRYHLACSGHRDRQRRGSGHDRLADRSRQQPVSAAACVLGRADPGRLLHRDRPRQRLHFDAWPAGVRRRRRHSDAGHQALGRIPGRCGVCRFADEHGRAPD